MTEEQYEKLREERILKLEQNGFYEDWRGMWIHAPSNKGYFFINEFMHLSDYNFEKFLECRCIYTEWEEWYMENIKFKRQIIKHPIVDKYFGTGDILETSHGFFQVTKDIENNFCLIDDDFVLNEYQTIALPNFIMVTNKKTGENTVVVVYNLHNYNKLHYELYGRNTIKDSEKIEELLIAGKLPNGVEIFAGSTGFTIVEGENGEQYVIPAEEQECYKFDLNLIDMVITFWYKNHWVQDEKIEGILLPQDKHIEIP